MPRYAKRRDHSEPEIVAALEKAGCLVYRELPVDLLVRLPRDMSGSKNPNWKDAARRVCVRCSGVYASYQKNRKYCSSECYNATRAKKPRISKPRQRKPDSEVGVREQRKRGVYAKTRPPFTLLCKKCCVKRPRYKGVKLCANCCRKQKSPQSCLVCSSITASHKRKTCSLECRQAARTLVQIGSKSHRWQGGKTSENMRLRNSKEAADWRAAVFRRDDFTCCECGQRGGKLQADHIKPWALYPEVRFDLDNGRTLCKPCHLKTDTWGWKAIYRESAHAQVG